MTFKLKSGNRTSFRSMGSSPAKQKDNKPSRAMQDKMAEVKAANLAETNKILRSQGKDEVGEIKESPAKQRSTKGGEGKDQDKILDDKGNHIGDWVNDKKVMFNDKQAWDKIKSDKIRKHLRQDLSPEEKKKKADVLKTLKMTAGAGKVAVGKVAVGKVAALAAGKAAAKKEPKKEKSPAKHQRDKSHKHSTNETKGGGTADIATYDDGAKREIPGRVKGPTTLPSAQPKKSPAKQVKTSGLGPRSSFGGVKNPELTKDKKKPFSTKVMKDGSKNKVHGVKDPGNWQPYKKKSPNISQK